MKSKLQKINAALLLSIASSTVSAAGFAIGEQGISNLGRANAGSAAVAQDSTTIFHNPAGMTYLERAEFSSGVSSVSIQSDFENEGSSLPAGLGSPPLTGGDGGIDRNDIFVPTLFYTRPLTDNIKFGLGITAPFGLVTEYNEDWTGRYHGIKSDLKTIDFNPSIAFKATDNLSLGFGVSAQYADLELTQMADLGTAAFLLGAPASLIQNADGKATLKGDSWGYGWNAGLILQATENTRVGLSYRSKVSHTFKGKGKILDANNNPVADGVGKIQGDLDLPEIVSLSLFHTINNTWSVAADVTWTRWSRFEELRIESDAARLNQVKPEDWENTLRYSLGVEYNHSPKWQFRTGVAYDETPLPSAERRTPRVPDNDRIWLSLGASYHYSDNIIIDAAYTHLFVNDSSINDTNDGGYTLSGEYEASVDVFGLQLRWLM